MIHAGDSNAAMHSSVEEAATLHKMSKKLEHRGSWNNTGRQLGTVRGGDVEMAPRRPKDGARGVQGGFELPWDVGSWIVVGCRTQHLHSKMRANAA